MARSTGLRATLTVAAFLGTVGPPTTVAQQQQAPTLYRRLGGYDALAAVTDDFIGRLSSDVRLQRFLAGLSADSKQRLRQLLLDQLCQVTGGPCVYIGRPMRQAHAGLGITQADWDAAVADLVATLNHFNVPQREQNEVLAAVTTLRPDIVERP